MDTPTNILSKEHEYILKVIDALMEECNKLESGKEIDRDFFENSIDFIRNYADKFHHAKEEDILFKEFKKYVDKGCTHCDPTEQMLYEHDLGRNFVKGMGEGLNTYDKEKLVENARGYANLLKEHIFKEDNIMYPMVDEPMSDNDRNKILDEFKKAENKFSKGIKERYINFANNQGGIKK